MGFAAFNTSSLKYKLHHTMFNSYIIRSLFLIFILSSCTIQSKKDNPTQSEMITDKVVEELPRIQIKPPSGKVPQLKLSEIAEDIKYVKLETRNEVLLKRASAYFDVDENSNYIVVFSGGIIFSYDEISGSS